MRGSVLSRKLRVLRAEQGLTIGEASKEAGVSADTLGLIERGKRAPQVSTLRKLGEIYGVSLDELLQAADEQEESALASSGKDDAPDPGIAALSPAELERGVLGAPVREGEEPEPVIDVEEVRYMLRQVGMERDAQNRWLQEYLDSPSSVRFAKRADAEAVRRAALLSQMYWVFLIDVESKLEDPRGVPFKGVLQLASEADETFRTLRAAVEERDRARRTEGRAG
jgi:transcriptional regulator with XRE-family HTH domain